jgi:RHS repeat-associated protein
MFGYLGVDGTGHRLKAPEMTLCLSTGRALDCRIRQKYSGSNYLSVLAVGDFVGDGAPAVLASTVTFRPDGLPVRTGALQVCRVTGDDTTGGASSADGNMQCTPWGGLTYPDLQTSATAARDQVYFMDLLGTGRMQVLYYHAGRVVNSTWQEDGRWELFAPVDMAREHEALDRIVLVTNGLGATSSVQYEDGITAGIVSQSVSAPPAYPRRVARAPGKLVSRLLSDNGVAGASTVAYSYIDPEVDLSGRGSLGFRTTAMVDEQSGLVTSTQYAQSWPFIGMMKGQVVHTGTGDLLQKTEHNFAEQHIAQGGGITTSFPYSETVTVNRFDPGGLDLGTVVTTNTYGDGWGNLTERTVTTSAASATNQKFLTKSAITYRNDSSTWLVGLPILLKETRTDPATGTLTRTIRKDYSITTGLQSTEEVEPGSTGLTRTVTFERTNNPLNPFGLVNTRTESWTDPYSGTSQSRQIDTVYDVAGRYPASMTNPLGHIETYLYQPGTGTRIALTRSNNSTTTGPNYLTTTWTVNGFGRVLKQLDADQTETRRYVKRSDDAPRPSGAVVAEITERFLGERRIASPQVTYTDTAGHVLQVRSWGYDGRAVIAEQTYDRQGRLYEQYWPRFADEPKQYLRRLTLYDVLNRPVMVETRDEGGSARTAKSTYTGMVTEFVNEALQKRTEQRNVVGLLEKVTDNLNGVTSFTYDPFGNLLTTSDPVLNKTIVEYDLLGRRTDLHDPDLGWIHYDVDPLGRVWKTTSPKQRPLNTWTRMVFDKLDRMIDRYETDLESHWIYDSATYGVGQLAEARTGNALAPAPDYQRIHAYDKYGRPATTTQLINGDTYVAAQVLDTWGRMSQQKYLRNTDAEKVFDYRYNDKGYLTRIERNGSLLWSVNTQDAANRVLFVQLGNGLQQTRSYNDYTGLPKKVLLQSADSSRRLEEGYFFDALGNVSQRSQYWELQGFGELFTYDGLNRIETSEVTGRPLQRFTYDALGNIKTKTNVSSEPYVYPPAGQKRPHGVTSIGGVGAFTYDENGNQETAPGHTASWTSFDMPLQLTKGTVKQNYVYGPEHQRVRMDRTDNSTATVYGGAQEVELSGGAVMAVRTYWPNGIGLEIDKPGQATELVWTHVDRLGSVIGQSDASGVLKDRLAYDAWGQRRTTDGASAPGALVDKHGFTGHEMLDQLDLVHMNGRVYDPLFGRFLSADPLLQDPTNGQSYNRYTYVLNNPTNMTDPTGFQSDPAKEPVPKEVKRHCSTSIDKLLCQSRTMTALVQFLQSNVGSFIASDVESSTSAGVKTNKISTTEPANNTSATETRENCQALGCINQSTREARPVTHHTGNLIQDMMMDEASKAASGVWNGGLAFWDVAKNVTIFGIGGVAEGGAVASSGVWGSIKATQPVWEGTVIPRSFEMLAGGRQVWVHPNATEHMAEYAAGMLNRGVSAEAVAVRSQAQLTSLQEAVKQATVRGMPQSNVIINFAGWELQFSRNAIDKLPVLKHARNIKEN